MAKKQSTKKKPVAKAPGNAKTTLSGIWHKHWQLISFSVLILGVLGFIGVQQLLVYNQKQQFKQAEKSLDALATEIIAATGQPTEVKKDASCGYRSAKWDQGERSCVVNVWMYYSSANNVPAAKLFTNRVNSYLELSSSIKDSFDENLYSDEFMGDDGFRASRDFHFKSNGLSCNIEYGLDPRATIIDSKLFRIALDCSGASKAEFYPVKN